MPPVGRGGLLLTGGHRRRGPDAYSLIYWPLDESAEPYTNRGNGGVVDLKRSFGGVTPGVSGPFTKAIGFNAGSISTFGPSGVTPNPVAFTYALWVYRGPSSAGTPILLSHSYGLSWPTSGKYGNGIVLLPGGGGAWQPGFYGASGLPVYLNTTAVIPLATWTHIACTYDGHTLKAYHNGAFHASATSAGTIDAIDWNGATGLWMLGGNAVLHANDTLDGRIAEVHVDSTVRDAAYIADLASR